MKTLFRELKSWERVFLFSVLLLFPTLSFLDFSLLHPGFCEIDEVSTLRHAWTWMQGYSLQPCFFYGTIHRMAVALSLSLVGAKSWALQVPALLAFILECLLLQRLASRLFGARAAFGALCFNALSAFCLARSRALLCYALLPCEMLLVLELATDSAEAAWRAWLAGVLAGLFFMEYEAWPVACLSLTVIVFFLKNRLSIKWLPCLLGGLLGFAAAAFLSRESLVSYFFVRSAFTLKSTLPSDLSWGVNLLKFFTGGHVLPSMGAENHPALAPWALPFLALGGLLAWKKEKWLLLWIGIGLLPLLAPSAGLTEANRGIATWPALALLVGLAWSALPDKKWLQVLLGLWLTLGAGLEAKAFLDSEDLLAPENYALSSAQMKAGRWLAEENSKQPIRFLSDLGYERGSELEWASSLSSSSSEKIGAEVIAWIPWEAVPALDKNAGIWFSLSDPNDSRHILLLKPNATWTKRLTSVNARLKSWMPYLNSYDRLGNLKKIRAWLDAEPGLDPWVRTVLWQKWMTDASILGIVADQDVELLLREKLVHAGPLNYPAYYLARSRPDLSAKLLAKARQMDPRLIK